MGETTKNCQIILGSYVRTAGIAAYLLKFLIIDMFLFNEFESQFIILLFTFFRKNIL